MPAFDVARRSPHSPTMRSTTVARFWSMVSSALGTTCCAVASPATAVRVANVSIRLLRIFIMSSDGWFGFKAGFDVFLGTMRQWHVTGWSLNARQPQSRAVFAPNEPGDGDVDGRKDQ